jgi:hypothetical protein
MRLPLPRRRPDPLRRALALVLIGAAAPALAAERGYTVTDFDRIDVVGAYQVIVETGKGPSARATGDMRAIDALKIEVRGRTLRVVAGSNAWGGWLGEKPAAPIVRLTVPMIREASLRGSGSLTVNRIRTQTAKLGVSGSGSMTVNALETDKLSAALLGSGRLTIIGKAASGQISTEGSGNFASPALRVDALTLSANSSGDTTLSGGRTATVQSAGSGNVTISGKPACTVAAVGAGEVSCGK